MTTEQKIAQLEKELTQLKEIVANPYKVGDWVTTTNTENNYVDNGRSGKVGVTYQIAEIYISGDTWYRKTKIAYGGIGDGVMVKSLRKATKEEIAEATKPKEIVVKIGTSQLPVTVNKDGIRVDGKRPDVKDIQALIDNAAEVCNTTLPWTVTVPYVKIGCCENVTIAQLQEVVNAYRKLQN
jgi:hypothetical protein